MSGYRFKTPPSPSNPLRGCNKKRIFLSVDPLKSLEKKGKTHEKAKKIVKQKKQGCRNKKQGLEGQGTCGHLGHCDFAMRFLCR